MRPIKDEGTNVIFGAEGYETLPAQKYTEENGVECIQTVWELSDEEMELLMLTKKIYVSVVGEKPQPISLDVIPYAKK